MDLLGDLLLARERGSLGRRDAGEAGEILAGQPLGRRRNGIADASV